MAVKDGRAELAGFVESSFEKTQAEDAAGSVTGVTGVTDRLKLLTLASPGRGDLDEYQARVVVESPPL